jgi:acyl-coenzyme A thioesterase PaaI-like protein
MSAGAASEDAAAIDLGEAVRRLMDVAVLTEAGDDVVLAAAADVRALTDRLTADGLRDEMPWPDDESMRRGHRPFSPVIGLANPLAPPLVVRVLDDRTVEGTCTMRPIHGGPPKAVHGGWVASLLDQLLGHANAAAGVAGLTAELTVRYRRPTPFDVPLTIRARTDGIDGRRIRSSGEIVANGEVTAEATGLFLKPSPELVRKLMPTAD